MKSVIYDRFGKYLNKRKMYFLIIDVDDIILDQDRRMYIVEKLCFFGGFILFAERLIGTVPHITNIIFFLGGHYICLIMV